MRFFEGVATLASFFLWNVSEQYGKIPFECRGERKCGLFGGAEWWTGSVLLILLVNLFYLWVWQVAIINGRCEPFMHGHLLRLILAGF